MITDGLVQTLLDKKIINEKTKVYVEYDKVDWSVKNLTIKEYFNIDLVYKNPSTNKFIFRLIRCDTGESILALSHQILLIDGMTPKMLSKAFNIKIDGNKEKLGKRRGRPRKHLVDRE